MIQGSCLCGDVKFEITGYVSPIQNCHAARCRKATGGAFTPEMLAHGAGFRWTSGQDLVGEYRAPLLKSPPAYKRAFCKACGSPLPVELEGTPYLILNSGLLDEDAGQTSDLLAFSNQKACWHEIMDELAPSKERRRVERELVPGE
ncbi:GFA family protein [Pelagibius sp. Alg239-R121]|uniref:GFA family protein n=1 Tax=Pelagibius sp. Alg239-R121 TaxID=2993448 RepID=UPI0024A78590|nr:GFA family protein [Pelagibius sp. Alg239-R121]